MEMLPGKRLSYSLRPVWEDATDEKEKNHERLHPVMARLPMFPFCLLSVLATSFCPLSTEIRYDTPPPASARHPRNGRGSCRPA